MVATSTALLMVAIVLLGNCEWVMQAAIGASYIILNTAYWALPLLGSLRKNWDLSRYNIILGARYYARNKGKEPSFTDT